MGYVEAFLVVAASTLAAVAASWVVGRLLSVDARRRHHDVGSPVFNQVGVMLAVLLAFVFSQVWGEYRTAALAISGECGALHGAAILASALPDGEGKQVIDDIDAYASTVVEREWPLMAQRRRSEEAAHALRAALRHAAVMNVSRPVEVSTQSQIVSLLAQAHAQRETRTFQITQSMPGLMWVMLLFLSIALVGFVIFAGAEYGAHMIFSGVFAGSVALVLVLVRMLDFPFEGALALGDGDFVKLLGQVSLLARGG